MKVAFPAHYLFVSASKEPIYALHRSQLEVPPAKAFGQFV